MAIEEGKSASAFVLSDADKKVMEKYGAFGEKMMYGKMVIGIIRSTVWVGPDGNLAWS